MPDDGTWFENESEFGFAVIFARIARKVNVVWFFFSNFATDVLILMMSILNATVERDFFILSRWFCEGTWGDWTGHWTWACPAMGAAVASVLCPVPWKWTSCWPSFRRSSFHCCTASSWCSWSYSEDSVRRPGRTHRRPRRQGRASWDYHCRSWNQCHRRTPAPPPLAPPPPPDAPPPIPFPSLCAVSPPHSHPRPAWNVYPVHPDLCRNHSHKPASSSARLVWANPIVSQSQSANCLLPRPRTPQCASHRAPRWAPIGNPMSRRNRTWNHYVIPSRISRSLARPV